MRGIVIVCLMVLMSCAPRGTMYIVPPETAVGEVSSVFVGTTRALGPEGIYSSGRSEVIRTPAPVLWFSTRMSKSLGSVRLKPSIGDWAPVGVVE